MRKRLFELAGLLALTVAVTGLWAAGARSPHDPNRRVEPRAGRPVDAEAGPHLSTEDLASQADLIAIGRCTETRSEWIGRNLFTLATVSISDVIKGDQRSSVTVALPGGVDAKRKFPVAMTYAGAPTVQLHEEVFLFLTGKTGVPETYGVVGSSQGKFTVSQDAQGRKTISRDPARPAAYGAGETGGSMPKAISLSDFRARVEAYLRRR